MLYALQGHLIGCQQRKTVLLNTEGIVLTPEECVERIKYSVISLFVEKCAVTGVFVANWIFNRDTNKFELGGCRGKLLDPVARLAKYKAPKVSGRKLNKR